MDAFSWLAIALLLACLALFLFVAAAESCLTAISRARLRLMAERGVSRADILQGYIHERESLLRAMVLARELSVVASIALTISLVTLESGHDWLMVAGVVVAALVLVPLLGAIPRAIVVRNPERWGLRMAPTMGMFKLLFGGIARVLDLPARAVQRVSPEEEQELMRLMELEDSQGTLEEDERTMIRGIFGLDETTAREIMTPRIDIKAVEANSPPSEAVRIIIDFGYSRIPIYEENMDRIAGLVYAKDLFRYYGQGEPVPPLTEVARKVYFVPESKSVDDLLGEMRKQRTHMAVVVDEHGGTAGLVTIEDILEEIVGEIEDEYDKGEAPIVKVSDLEALVDGRVSIDDVNDLFHTSIEADDFDTVGGCVFHLLGRMPAVGDEAETDGLKLRVLSVDGHRVKRVRVTAIPGARDYESENGNGHNGNRNGNSDNGY